jgi:hypothetical protein
MQHLDPSAEVGLGPVAISAADVDHTVSRELGEDEFDFPGRCVIGIDEQGNAVGVAGIHEIGRRVKLGEMEGVSGQRTRISPAKITSDTPAAVSPV